MPSLKEMRTRIGSVKATQKITKAMQMVAAAKLRRAQDAAQNARPYAERMAAVIANLAAGVLRRLLRPAQLGRRHHLHRLRDLLRGFHASDPIAHVLEAGHPRVVPARL